jgi:hypothetical protein
MLDHVGFKALAPLGLSLLMHAATLEAVCHRPA